MPIKLTRVFQRDLVKGFGPQIVELTLERPSIIAAIRFRNFYVAKLSVDLRTGNSERWITVLRDHSLMADPNLEDDAQFYHQLSSSLWPDMSRIACFAIRFILVQPSTAWETIRVDEVECYASLYPLYFICR